MPDAPAWFLLTLFLCPMGETREAYCGPATGAIGPYRTEAECHSNVWDYLAAQERAKVGYQYRYACYAVSMGTQRGKPK